eukprot:366036-Chlamydomonas_euryale.AAC.4
MQHAPTHPHTPHTHTPHLFVTVIHAHGHAAIDARAGPACQARRRSQPAIEQLSAAVRVGRAGRKATAWAHWPHASSWSGVWGRVGQRRGSAIRPSQCLAVRPPVEGVLRSAVFYSPAQPVSGSAPACHPGQAWPGWQEVWPPSSAPVGARCVPLRCPAAARAGCLAAGDRCPLDAINTRWQRLRAH